MGYFHSQQLFPFGKATYQIDRSLRFNAADSAVLSRTPAGAGTSTTKATIAFWTKFLTPTISNQPTFLSTTGNNFIMACNRGTYSGQFFVRTDGTNDIRYPALKDPTAWMHVNVAIDTTLVTAADRYKVSYNGVQQVSVAGTMPAQNSAINLNSAVAHYIGEDIGNVAFADFLLAEIFIIDGQALDPTSFGATVAGVFNPILYTGTFGTNGSYLKFSDNSGATATTIGKDSSGASSNWTPTNISVLAGTGNDSLVDTPTNYGTDTGVGGEVRGNYSTLNEIMKGANATVADGSLSAAWSGAAITQTVFGTQAIPSTGFWYFEFTPTASSNGNLSFGVSNSASSVATFPGGDANSWGYFPSTASSSVAAYNANVSKQWGTNQAGNGVGITYGVAIDVASGKIYIRDATGWFAATTNTDPTPTTAMYSNLTGTLFPCVGFNTVGSQSGTVYANFGQRPFAYTAPTGYLALCTQNRTAGATVALPATFTGNGNADGPVVWADGIVTSVTINGNVASLGTHFDRIAGGMKLRTASASYNTAGSNTITVATYSTEFKYARAQVNV